VTVDDALSELDVDCVAETGALADIVNVRVELFVNDLDDESDADDSVVGEAVPVADLVRLSSFVSVKDTLGLLSVDEDVHDGVTDPSAVIVGMLSDGVRDDDGLRECDNVGVGDRLTLTVRVYMTVREALDDPSGDLVGNDFDLDMEAVFVAPVSLPTRRVLSPSADTRNTLLPMAAVGLEGLSIFASDVAKPSWYPAIPFPAKTFIVPPDEILTATWQLLCVAIKSPSRSRYASITPLTDAAEREHVALPHIHCVAVGVAARGTTLTYDTVVQVPPPLKAT
jgi:hypothetical protein